MSFQAYSPLERGILTGKIAADTPVDITLAKSRIKWFAPENRPQITALTEQWAPLCRKYGCTMTQLVIAWTAMQGKGNNVNVLCGARKLGQIEENAKGGTAGAGFLLDAADAAAMLEATAGLRSAAAT